MEAGSRSKSGIAGPSNNAIVIIPFCCPYAAAGAVSARLPLLAYCRDADTESPLNQNHELTRVKLRIRTLTERTIERGCTEAEAMAAATMVGRLLERYALTMDEVDFRQQPCVQVLVPVGGMRRRPIDICVPSIARFCDCKVWLACLERQAHYVFFGFDRDAQLAAYLFDVIGRAMRNEVAHFKSCGASAAGTALRRASTSFQHGVAVRVGERLDALHAQREAAVTAQRPTGNALIIARHQVVEDAFRATKVRLRGQQALSLRRNAAFRAGKAAGERVNLNRPIEHGGRVLLD